MPGAQSRDAPRFKGQKICRFLKEFEALAKAAALEDSAKCEHIVCYCTTKEEEFIESLSAYKTKDWSALKTMLKNAYPSDDDERHYTLKELRKFYRKDCTISSLKHFDAYYRSFTVMASSLEERKQLAERDKNEYFLKGIHPRSLSKKILSALEREKKWVDTTAPPKIEDVVSAAKKLLKRDRFVLADSDSEDGSSDSSDNDDDRDSKDSDSSSSEEEYAKPSSHRRYKKELSPKEKKSDPESPKPKATDVNDIAARIERLTIVTEAIQKDQQNRE